MEAYEDAPQVVVIDRVEPETMKAWAFGRFGVRQLIDLRVMPSGVLVLPARGEHWLVRPMTGRWILVGRLPFQDERVVGELEQGTVVVGGERTVIVGSTIQLKGEVQVDGAPLRPYAAAFVKKNGLWSLSDHASTFTPGLYRISVNASSPVSVGSLTFPTGYTSKLYRLTELPKLSGGQNGDQIDLEGKS